MNKKPLIFLFFVSLTVFFLFFQESTGTRKVPLLLKSPGDAGQNQLRSIETVIEREDALSLVFKFSKNASYEIQYSQEESELILYLYNISKRSFKRLLKMEKNYFKKILLSYSKDNIYRIIFRLKENIIPLPFASREIGRAHV